MSWKTQSLWGTRPTTACPFALAFRYPVIRERVEFFAREYKKAGIEVSLAFADWEIDGPMEWNSVWEAAKKCARCQENISGINDFTAFQNAYRKIRSEMQRKTYADVLKAHFPKVLAGNYAVYPHNGFRYWYDYFNEFLDSGEPVTFHVPETEGPVVSALRLGNKLLVRRTDFTEHPDSVPLRVGDIRVQVPCLKGKCQILSIE